MKWVKVSEKKPEIGSHVITRHLGYNRKGDAFESHNNWVHDWLDVCFPDGTGHITHWWDGPFDMEQAISAWNKG